MRGRSGGPLLLLLLLLLAVLVVAEDTVPAESNGDSSTTHSGVRKLGQPDETSPKGELVHEDGGSNSGDTVGNNKNKENSTEGTGGGRRDEPVQQRNDKGSEATESSQAKDFLQDPLIVECDPLHRCVIEEKKFIACLKVPGEDSLALSLLMDNKGVHPLDVNITAPDYVTLAEDTVHVEANNHNETQVSVYINDAATNNTAIVLKVAAEETCTINIHGAIARETGPATRMRLTPTRMLAPVLVLVAVVGACVKLVRTRRHDGPLPYQKLDAAELPVSVGGGRKAPDAKWDDDSWGDDWDDVEAPLTPSKPANPSSSSSFGRLAARRSAKDGWKD